MSDHIKNLRDIATQCDANEWGVPLCTADRLRAAAAELEAVTKQRDDHRHERDQWRRDYYAAMEKLRRTEQDRDHYLTLANMRLGAGGH